MGVKVLSLFDGMSCGMIAAERAGLKVDKYYASEIDKYAQIVSAANYPQIKRLGDVTRWKEWGIDWSSIDLLIGGSPCQGFSFAGKQLAFDDPRSALFFEYVNILNYIKSVNPNVKFLLENVKMKKEFEQYITYHTEQALGNVEKILINSALVSAQNRNRYYWTNFEVTQPDDKGILLKDILETELDVKYTVNRDALPRYIDENGKVKGFRDGDQKSNCLTASMHKGFGNDGCTVVRATVQANAEHTYNGKSPTLTASMGVGGGNVPLLTDYETSSKYKGRYIDKHERLEYRKLTPLECERLQTLPDNWTDCVSNTQRYKMIGNGWTIDVIAHILKHINN